MLLNQEHRGLALRYALAGESGSVDLLVVGLLESEPPSYLQPR